MKPGDLRLSCFSPLVMLATFVIEIALAIYVLMRYKLNEVGRLVVIALFLLAAFQAAEYAVCQPTAVDSLWASRIGYVAITFLPPLGIHLAYAIAKAKKRSLLLPAYGTAVGFMFYFLLVGQGLTGHACLGNYVIFQVAPAAAWLYTLYYYGWLLLGIWLMRQLMTPKTKAAQWGMVAGYLAFIVPTTLVNVVDPGTIDGIPSIMCGFAVLFALVLALWVMPKSGEVK